MAETIAEIVNAHRESRSTPEATVARTYGRIRALDDAAIFISLREELEAITEARALAREGGGGRPLFGVPVAIKDNIDVAGLPTTAACPAFAYRPEQDAAVVARLRRAGAIVIGKTNLDQFATGLVGVRSPYGVPRNLFNRDLIPGGSSSGSAIAVAAGLVPLALGTDTAGSGRVPAGISNIVGLKPSLGLVSNDGVVPACRTLDCVSVFALTVDDAMAALAVMAAPDPADANGRSSRLTAVGTMPPKIRLGVPRRDQRLFFGDRMSADAYDDALTRFVRLGATIEEIDVEPFYETARLLYEGPWVAERYIVARNLIAVAPDDVHPVTREIIRNGARPSAADAFEAFYRLEALRSVSADVFRRIDALVVPTAPTVYTVKDVLADPVQLNSRLGTYTNFVNLLDLCGLAVPASVRPDGTPFGVTLLAPAGNDAVLAAIGRVFHADSGLPMGALGLPLPPLTPVCAEPAAHEVAIAVVGAHMSGMPLNDELRERGSRLLQATTTASDYRLYALAETQPPKPGLLRVGAGKGSAIEVELWAMPVEAFGSFVAGVPRPLAIGTLTLRDGRSVKGFLVEADAVVGARDISNFGGWRAFVAAEKVPA